MNRVRWLKAKVWLRRLVVGLFLLVTTLVVACSYRMLGSRLFVVTSGSMRPVIPMGSLILVKKSSSYKVGEVVTFRQGRRIITHRLAYHLSDGSFRTQGDANKSPDSFTIKQRDIFGRVVVTVPRLGRLLMLVKTKVGVVVLVVIPGVILVWEELKKLLQLLS